MASILQDSIACLHQGIALVRTLSVDDYTEVNPQVRSGSIGAHIRHNLDHYLQLMDAWETGQVDYDRRARDPRLEEDPAYAVGVMESLVERLEAIDPSKLTQSLRIKMDCGSDDAQNWSASTLQRELQFLISHTIHHYALVAMLCRLRGIEPEATFGVAPSTLKYRTRASRAS